MSSPCHVGRRRPSLGAILANLGVLAAVIAGLGCDLVPFDVPEGAGDGGADVPLCVAARDCDDGNPCTIDRCESGVCAYDLADAGASCADGDACNGDELCDGMGRCTPGTPVISCSSPWTPTRAAGAPSARQRHTAVWTGSKMIVWGGKVTGSPSVTATGGAFDPVANAWTPTSTVGAPPPRHSHRAVWTGSKMIVWGGFGAVDTEVAGGIYDPDADTWAPMSTIGAPTGRIQFSMVWTGSEVIVWGGLVGQSAVADGAAYDPATDTWTPIPAAGAPSQRFDHSAVWTGSAMIVWGGNDLFDWHSDGTFFDPTPPAKWSITSALVNAPEAREGHTGLWTGDAMLIWGGWTGGPYANSGGRYDPAIGSQGAWTPITTAGAPSARWHHEGAWTGSKLMVWGGCGGDTCKEIYGDGGLWTPGANGGDWAPIAADANLSARTYTSLVIAGSRAIVWGGDTGSGNTDTGAMITQGL